MKKFALLMALMLCLVSLVACGDKKPAEAPAAGETLTGTAEGFSNDTEIEVEVVKDGDTITAVTVTNHGESIEGVDGVSDKVVEAIDAIPAAIVEANGTDGVEIISGATYTSEGIMNAVNSALGQ